MNFQPLTTQNQRDALADLTADLDADQLRDFVTHQWLTQAGVRANLNAWRRRTGLAPQLSNFHGDL